MYSLMSIKDIAAVVFYITKLLLEFIDRHKNDRRP